MRDLRSAPFGRRSPLSQCLRLSRLKLLQCPSIGSLPCLPAIDHVPQNDRSRLTGTGKGVILREAELASIVNQHAGADELVSDGPIALGRALGSLLGRL